MSRRLLAALLLAGSAPAAALPDFIPKPSNIYDDYVALEMPRAGVPVGALWVQDYGPTGVGASPDNLTTERSLSQVTINNDLQLNLTLGILNLFGLDPSLKNRLQARFADLSVVRVRDMTRLAGPDEEPRIYEAIKAGVITITTDNEIGVDLETRALGRNLPVTGRSDNGRRRSFSIDGKDMFIAFRVATSKKSRRRPDVMRLERSETGWKGSLDGRSFVIEHGTGPDCSSPSAAAQSVLPTFLAPAAATQPAAPVATSTPPSGPLPPAAATAQTVPSQEIDLGIVGQPVAPTASKPVVSLPPELPAAVLQKSLEPSLALRVPVSDGRGGIFDRASVHLQSSGRDKAGSLGTLCSVTGSDVRASVSLLGSRLEPFAGPKAPQW